MSNMREVYLSVDVETSGPIPGEFSLLSIGACNVDNDKETFSCQLKPTTRNADPKALEVTGLSLDRLEREGLEPSIGMKKFGEWVTKSVGSSGIPVFVGFNAPFDWSFINYYFHRYIGENPFGFTALDIKSMYMGAAKSTWLGTKSSKISSILHPTLKGDRDALHDALYQAELFRLIQKMNQ